MTDANWKFVLNFYKIVSVRILRDTDFKYSAKN